MRLRRIILFFCIWMVTPDYASSIADFDKIVTDCMRKSQQFAETERKYISRKTFSRDEPNSVSPDNEELVHTLYEIEKRQRPFECIARCVNWTSLGQLTKNSKYQELVSKCKMSQPQPVCDFNYPYRTFDGTCNNLFNPKYGSSMNCLRRIANANYKGPSGFRESVCGKKLPEPRFISLRIHEEVDSPNSAISHMTAFFGQFIAHDVSDVPLTTIDGKSIDCCSNRQGNLKHPQCAEIILKKNDPFYSKFNVTCVNMFRSSLCDTCSVGKRIQINQVTSFLDLSPVYGFTEFSANQLRTLDGTGKLMVQKTTKSGDLLPRLEDEPDRCGNTAQGEFCFTRTGDRRVDQTTLLMSLQIVFLREHNRIATELKSMNPYWNEEKLYQEARKINIAQYQVMVYKELIPLMVGPDLMTLYDLWVTDQGMTRYDPSVDATISVEFNTAAYRLHTLVNKIVIGHQAHRGIYLRNFSVDPSPLYHNRLSYLMEGLCQSPSKTYNRFVTKELTNFLYKRPSGSYGYDVAAFNVLRGRDNGLPSYTEMVHHLTAGRVNIQGFDGLNIFIDDENIDELKKVYCDVRDIDLWVGMLNERVPENSVVGPTAAFIIAYQMNQLKFGDRFYLEHYGNFNEQQLNSIRQTSLSGVLCSNTNIKRMHVRALETPSNSNPMRFCKDIERTDLSFWKEF